MSEPILPAPVRSLILERLDSVGEMEALLLLRGEPEDGWDSVRVAGRLYVGSGEAARLLSKLHERKLLTQEPQSGMYRYEPETAELAAAVDQLAETYRTRLIPLTKLIHSKATTSLQRFADAFRLRKDT